MTGSFPGYARPTGRVGVRNHVLVLPLDLVANSVVRQVKRRVPGVATVELPFQPDPADPVVWPPVSRTLLGYLTHPNVARAFAVFATDDHGLVAAARAQGCPVEAVSMAQLGGLARTVEVLALQAERALGEAAAAPRQPVPVAELVVGLECGGSDGFSGLTANPALGVASDLLVAAGATTILAETTECIGAEHLLARRATTPELGERFLRLVHAAEAEAMTLGVDIRGAQPSLGNIAGGLTTIEEKSLGCVHKGGHAPLTEVVAFAQRPAQRGLVFMDTPGHDIEQLTGMVAGGAQLVVFTTGRGTPTGSAIAPVVKVATNGRTFRKMQANMDLDAGRILTGEASLESMGHEILEKLLAVAAGEPTRSEVMEESEFALFRGHEGAWPL